MNKRPRKNNAITRKENWQDKQFNQYVRAVAVDDVKVLLNGNVVFECSKENSFLIKSVTYDKGGNGYITPLCFDVKLPLTKFMLLS